MLLDPVILLIIVVVTFGCAVVQATIGFGFGLLAIPILLWTGLPLPDVLALVGVAAAVQCTIAATTYRQHIKWKPLISQTIVRIAAVPVGVVLLGYLVSFGTDRIKQVVGLFLLLTLLLQWAFKVKPRRHLHWGWNVLAGAASGFIGGLVGMGGPPIVLWASAHRWTSKQTRAFLWTSIAVTAPYILLLLVLKFGAGILIAGLVGALTFPVLYAGSKVGLRVGRMLPRPQLRNIVLALLLILAVWSLAAPYTEALFTGSTSSPSKTETTPADEAPTAYLPLSETNYD